MWWLCRTSIRIIAVWLNIHMFNTLTRIVSQRLLSQVKTLKGFLQCTSMNIPVDSFPQELFAMHLYSPLWFLLMLMIVSSFPLVTWPVLTYFQEKFRGGVPTVTLHCFVTFLPSSTVTFCICSKAAGARRDEREKWVFQYWDTKTWVKVHLGKHNSHGKKKDKQLWKTWTGVPWQMKSFK